MRFIITLHFCLLFISDAISQVSSDGCTYGWDNELLLYTFKPGGKYLSPKGFDISQVEGFLLINNSGYVLNIYAKGKIIGGTDSLSFSETSWSNLDRTVEFSNQWDKWPQPLKDYKYFDAWSNDNWDYEGFAVCGSNVYIIFLLKTGSYVRLKLPMEYKPIAYDKPNWHWATDGRHLLNYSTKNKKQLKSEDIRALIDNGAPIESTKIGSQTWMTENLSVSKFRDGSLIVEATTIEEWNEYNSKGTPAWSYYDFDISNIEMGKYYNWHAVNSSKGLAPTGWRIPTRQDWTTLQIATSGSASVSGRNKTATLLKSSIGWEDGFNGKNTLGFNASPTGALVEIEEETFANYGTESKSVAKTQSFEFEGQGLLCVWWSTTLTFDKGSAKVFMLLGIDSEYSKSDEEVVSLNSGLPVRCVKN